MKKTKGIILLLCVCLLTGCSSVQTTEQEDEEISEYIAGVLLKHDSNYTEGLILASNEENEEEQEKEEPVVSNKPNQDSSQAPLKSDKEEDKKPNKDSLKPDSSVPFGKIIGNEKVKVQVKKYGTYQCYPENAAGTYFSLEAPKGKELLVAELTLSNSSSSKQKVKTLKQDLSITLQADGKSYSSSLTLLENDLHFFNASINGKRSKTAVVVFEVPKGKAFKELEVTIAKGDKTSSLVLTK